MYVNHELVSDKEAVISIMDHGYLYGLGLFETFRTYAGQPFLLESHLERLQQGCEQMGMLWDCNEATIRQQIDVLLQTNKLDDGYFRLNVSAGPQPIGLPEESYTDVTQALFIKPVPQAPLSKKLWTVQTKRNTPEGSYRLKSHHYLNNVLAKRETPVGYEGIMLTKEGYVAEGVVSNVFFVHDQQLYTPALSLGILNGITRQWVIKVAKRLHIKVEEGAYDLNFAQEADEVFITNSIQELVPVEWWDERTFSKLTPQALTSQLMNEFKAEIKGWTLT